MQATGSVQGKNGYLYCVIRVRDKDGKTVQKWEKTGLTAKGNKKAAKKMLDEILDRYNSGMVYSKDIPFADWVEKWLDHKKPEVEETTIQGYRQYFDKHIGPFYRERGTILQTMRPLDVQDYYDAKIAEGLSSNTVDRHKNVISGALKYAYMQELIPSNPADRASVPRVPSTFEATPCTIEQAQQLLKAAEGKPVYPAIFIALYFGLRREEILGLTWSAVDMEGRKIEIFKTVTRHTSLVVKDRPKNKSSRRVLIMPDEAFEFFRKLKARQTEERVKLGAAYEVNDWVCKHADGRPLKPDYISSAYACIRKTCGLENVRFHDLRHTVGTLLYDNETPLKDIQMLLGHSKISTTADLYVHPSEASRARTAAALGNILKISS